MQRKGTVQRCCNTAVRSYWSMRKRGTLSKESVKLCLLCNYCPELSVKLHSGIWGHLLTGKMWMWGRKGLGQVEPTRSVSVRPSPCAGLGSVASRVQFCDPVGGSSPGSSVHGILQVRRLEWASMPSSTGSSWLGLNPGLLHCRQILYPWASGETSSFHITGFKTFRKKAAASLLSASVVI